MGTFNVNEIMGNISDSISAVDTSALNQSKFSLVIAVVVGLIICFLGLKLIKILTTISGLLIGASIGGAVSVGFKLEGIMPVIVILACAIVLGAISFFMYRFGVFLLVLCYGVGISSSFIQPQSLIPFLICMLIGILAGVLAAIYIDPIIIVATSLSGGIAVGAAFASLIGMSGSVPVSMGIAAVLAIAGMCVQFMLHSRKIGRKEKIYSKQVKEEVSRESEVEKARKILEDDNEEED